MTNKELAIKVINGDLEGSPNAISIQVFNILREVDDLYTNDGDSYLTDAEYDKLRLVAQKFWPSDPYFMGVGSSVREDKVKLPFKMGSLDQVQVGELDNWLKSKKGFKRNFVITDKMDGVSVLLVYDSNGDFQMALTRGDGYQGQDITRHVKLIPDVPKKVTGRLVVRAEIIFAESTFKKIQNKVTRQDNTPFKNPRNAIAGLVNHKTVNELACKNMTVFAYSTFGMNELSKAKQLIFLENQGFRVVGFEKVCQQKMTEDFLKNKISERKNVLDFAIDGIVVEFNNEYKRNELESDDLNPAYAFKYKVLDSDNIREAKVVGVEWNLSKHGFAKPKVKLEPFDLQGVTISNATGFNAKYILDNNIGAGSIVKITRSGDVIPHILEVVKSTKADMPDNINNYYWTDNEVDLVIKNKDTDEIKQKQLVSWATSMGIDGLKAGTVEKVFAVGYKTPADLVTLSKSLWVHLIGRNGEKIFNSIRKVLNPIDLHKLMGSYPSFGVGIGVRKVKLLLDSDPLLSTKILDGKLNRLDIVGAGGYDEKSADKVIDGYGEFLKFLEDIDGLYAVVVARQKFGRFVDQKICFTGFRDKELQELVEKEGGTISSGVSKNTDLLVALDKHSQSSKVLKAEQLGVKVESKEEFEKQFDKVNVSKSVKVAFDADNSFFDFG
jgi:NAD-dependent DNA ligase